MTANAPAPSIPSPRTARPRMLAPSPAPSCFPVRVLHLEVDEPGEAAHLARDELGLARF
jgi:hypothetical protein